VIEELRALAGRVAGPFHAAHQLHTGGRRCGRDSDALVPLLRELGVDATWDVIKGDQAFFSVTKAFHNALHGKPEQVTAQMYDIFRANTETNLRDMNFTGDAIFVHDPQPAGLVARKAGDWPALGLAVSHRRIGAATGRLGVPASVYRAV
jgi:trehalose synthase